MAENQQTDAEVTDQVDTETADTIQEDSSPGKLIDAAVEEVAVSDDAEDQANGLTTADENTVTESSDETVAEDAPKAVDEPAAEEKLAEPPIDDAASVDEAPSSEEVESGDVEAETIGAESGDADTDATDQSLDASEVAPRPLTGMIGYTGVILGEVIKLEDLDEPSSATDAAMAEDDLKTLIESTLTNVSEHEIVTGRVVSIGEKDVVIDIGFKSDGIVSKGEFDEDLTAGDEVEVYLERIEDYHGQLVLSKTKADTVRRWRKIESAFDNEEVLEGTIVRRIKGGMIVELFEGMEAFLPGSQIDVRPVRDFDAYLEKRMEFKIVKLNPMNENIVVSHKALIEKDLQAQRQTILATMEPGQILEGTVKNITDFGVFIDLGGVDGLLHITDLSWGRVSHPSELVTLDEQLNVVVLDYDRERQRISLGLKQLLPHPWETIGDKFTTGATVDGKVVSITDYGAFVELEKGIEGLVHISEMSWTEHIRHPSQMVSLGQIVPIKILNIDTESKKISLGMKQLEPDPWNNIAERYPPGVVMRGKVRNITNFGVFVEIEPGIDGLVHISDLSWTKRIKHPSEMVKKGQELDVVVLNIDTDDRRISLGHKQVDTNPWNQFMQVYAEGERTGAVIESHDEKGVVVALPLGAEALIPTRELKNPEFIAQSYPIGGKMDNLIVIRLNAGQKEILLSEIASDRAKEHAERDAEKREKRDTRRKEQKEIESYREKASASGPTTLGELSGLAELKAQMEATESRAPKTAADDKTATEKTETDKAATEEASVEEGVDAQTDEASGVEETPSTEEKPADDESPAVEEVPAIEEKSAEEEKPKKKRAVKKKAPAKAKKTKAAKKDSKEVADRKVEPGEVADEE